MVIEFLLPITFIDGKCTKQAFLASEINCNKHKFQHIQNNDLLSDYNLILIFSKEELITPFPYFYLILIATQCSITCNNIFIRNT